MLYWVRTLDIAHPLPDGKSGFAKYDNALYLKSTYYACKYTIEAMKARGGGAIVNVASISGVTGGIARQS